MLKVAVLIKTVKNRHINEYH